MVRAAIVGVHRYGKRTDFFVVSYRILKRGPKPIRERYWVAKDELEAFIKMQELLRKKGYKL